MSRDRFLNDSWYSARTAESGAIRDNTDRFGIDLSADVTLHLPPSYMEFFTAERMPPSFSHLAEECWKKP